jgi:formylglycine-generating enzyme
MSSPRRGGSSDISWIARPLLSYSRSGSASSPTLLSQRRAGRRRCDNARMSDPVAWSPCARSPSPPSLADSRRSSRLTARFALGLVVFAAAACGRSTEPQAKVSAAAPTAVTPAAVASGTVVARSGGSPPTPPSCAAGGPGLSDCGANKESCCTSPRVAGGTYYRTYKNNGSGATGEAHPATLSTFNLDKYLVTVGRFRQFVSAWKGGAGYTPPSGSGKHAHLNGGKGLKATGGGYEPGWAESDSSNIAPTNANLASCSPYTTWTTAAASQENLPINCVNWWESYAFCIWDGSFLPSEAEYEYAAAGGSQQREYPWGSAAPGTACPGTGCQYAIYNCDYPSGSGSCTGVTNIAPVGTATSGAGAWGQLDLAGNVFEWNLDWSATYVNPCVDCANLTAGFYRVDRGGALGHGASSLLSPARGRGGPPTTRSFGIGFRCSRSP